ncbi:hypothetical protein [Psychrilyobacter sp.]|uniref:hypothetical protein n=1 Tax=Psychrilyobacter sp. TaxID=2586924 RepID=UPI00301757F5
MNKMSKFKMTFLILSFIFFSPVALYGLLKKEKKGNDFYNRLVIFFSFKAFLDTIIYFKHIQTYFFTTFGYVLFWLAVLSFMYKRIYDKQ